MPGLLSRILPRETTFFDLFVQQAENVHQAAIALVQGLENFEDPIANADRIEKFEHIGDTITHSIITRLNQTFITPFDREDIHELASKIDDVIDLMDAVATRLVRDSTAEMVAAVRLIEKQDHILDHCIEINRLENVADRQSRALIGTLFDQEKDPVQIIKWKEIIETLEYATDKCEDVANVIETVTLKNA